MDPADENNFTESTEAVADSSEELHKISTSKLRYQVDHGHFKWSIEKFSSFPDRNDKYILSPIFEMGKTWWYIALHPKVKICGQDKISLNIIRHKSDPGPETVTVAYRLGLESGENKIWFKPGEGMHFKKGYCYGFQTSVLGHLEDFLFEADEKNNNDITLSVLCEIYAKYALKVNTTLSSCRKSDINPDLSSDILAMLQTENNADTMIEIPNFRRKAHKSVLSARSKTLARIFEDDKSFIQLSCTRSCLNCVLLYMYSGDFDTIAENAVFSIGLYELACELSLFKLRDVLTPCKIELKSRITVEECKIACNLHDLKITDFSPVGLESPVYFDGTTGIGIKISLQHMDNLDYVGLRVKVSGILAALDFSMELSILNNNHEPFEVIPPVLFQNSDAVFKNLIFTYGMLFSVSDIEKCFESDSDLCLIFECKRYLLTHLPETSANANKQLPVPCNDPHTWLEDLSSDLNSLFRTGYLSDITLSTFMKNFKLHRSVLGARSSRFHTLFQYNQHKNGFLPIFKFEHHILELLLMYIYCGRIEENCDLDTIDILELYEASEEFGVMSLKEGCSKFLSLHLDRDLVFEILLSAERFGNSHLISECKHYINKHQLEQGQNSRDSEDTEEKDV